LILAATLLTVGTGLALPLVWGAHIGFDRALGYGLKYPSAFGDTHLGQIGKLPRLKSSAGDPANNAKNVGPE
jgi:Domain of unknown function (DUF4260)